MLAPAHAVDPADLLELVAGTLEDGDGAVAGRSLVDDHITTTPVLLGRRHPEPPVVLREGELVQRLTGHRPRRLVGGRGRAVERELVDLGARL